MRKRFTIKDELSSFTATMDARLLEPPPVVHIQCEDLGRKGSYCLPHLCKYVAWFIVLVFVVSSCVVLVIYGLGYGKMKTNLWLAAFFLSFLFGTFVTDAVRILIVATIKSVFLRRNLVIRKRKINPALLSNPPNPAKKKAMLNLRRHHAKLYSPTPFSKLQNRLDDIRYNIEMSNLLTDIVIYLPLILIAGIHLQVLAHNLAFYSTNAVLETFLNGRYTRSFNFTRVDTYDTLMKYLNETLLPALFPNPKNSSSGTEGSETYRKRRTAWDFRAEAKPPPSRSRKRQILLELDAVGGPKSQSVLTTSWTINPNLKLMGKARFRQVRVKTDSCKEIGKFEVRNAECAYELGLFNVETRDFSINWARGPPVGLTGQQASPWKYQSAWETRTLPVLGEVSAYPGGGYVLELGRTLEDGRTVLEFLDAFEWVDMRTRALFVEFTLYCVNADLFNVVSIIAERSATGYFIPSHTIQTFTLRFDLMEPSYVIMIIIFYVLLCLLFVREILRIYRCSLKAYICRAFSMIDVTMLVCVVLIFIFIPLNAFVVASLTRNLETAGNNEFVSFTYAAFFHFSTLYLGSLLMCLLALKLLRLESYAVAFYQAQDVLTQCYKRARPMLCITFILVIAFAFFFHLTQLNYHKEFSSLRGSLVTLFSCSFITQKSFHGDTITSPLYVAPLFLLLFVILISCFFVNVFTVITFLYFSKVRERRPVKRYEFFQYARYFFTLWRQKETLRDRYERTGGEAKPTTLRLRGGGNKASKKGDKMETCDVGAEELLQVYLKDLVTKKPIDTTEYVDLASDRVEALKYLVMYHLSEDAKVRSIFGDLSLRFLFHTLTTESSRSDRRPENYFFVVRDSGKEVFEKGIFSKMKKVVEDFGRERGLIIKEDSDVDEIALSDKLVALDEKLSILLKRTHPK